MLKQNKCYLLHSLEKYDKIGGWRCFMGKFDGILLCSDWDGTLCEGDVISKNNIEAIRYFQKNGGKFTLASGRYAGHFKRFENEISPNTDLICVGGSCIMSANGEILYERFW